MSAIDPPISYSVQLIDRISHYTGRQAINRLRFLAQTCPQLSLTAYQLALDAIVQHTWDIALYKDTLVSYNAIASSNNLPTIPLDQTWLESTQNDINQTLSRLENDLKHNTTNLIKDGIRISYRELGAHYRKTGDLANAHRAFSKAREYATTALHIAELSLATLDLAFDTENFKLARSNVTKAQVALDTLAGSLELKDGKTKAGPNPHSNTSFSGSDITDPTGKELHRWNEKVNIVNGITLLAQGEFSKATTAFLRLGREVGDNTGKDLLATTSDIVVYTTLCALASLDRQQLKDRVIDNLELRSLMETDPQLRQILIFFRENRYRQVFQYLQDCLPIYQTDLYLAEQIDRLMMLIQERAIVQYFSPFSLATLSKASEVFGWPVAVLQQRLIQCIQAGSLKAQLDLTSGVLIAHREKTRASLIDNVIDSAQRIELESKAALLRLKLISAEIIVKESNQPSNNTTSNPEVASRSK